MKALRFIQGAVIEVAAYLLVGPLVWLCRSSPRLSVVIEKMLVRVMGDPY